MKKLFQHVSLFAQSNFFLFVAKELCLKLNFVGRELLFDFSNTETLKRNTIRLYVKVNFWYLQ